MTRRGRPPLGPTEDGSGTRRLSEQEERSLAGTVAEAYYLEDRSMVDIAERLGITRFQVARLLQFARSSGIVSIDVRLPGGVDEQLSERLRDALGIERAIVHDVVGDSPRTEMGRALAELLPTVVQPSDVVGVTWSRTIVAMSEHLKTLPPCTLVQLAGHITSEISSPGSVEVIRRLADVSGGRAFPIYAPLVAPDAYVATALRGQRDLATAFEFYPRISVAVITIGAWLPGESSIYDTVGAAEQDLGLELGAVGEISGRLFDAEGRTVSEVLDDRVLGISLDELRNVPKVVASVYGAGRAAATLAAARSGLFTTLIADRAVASAVLELAETAPVE
ncbi:sugar-binding transcriptional regulator [Naasia sp. SYSU D00057]|uniref:sugar-binding transcriptional regulator n=1 Tax=Naasia sp. SYSU D00057 TaxID=2817380 RepID=UPI001B3064ED|nr:sugar-binding domain-containing protein [Naasia sp. SYSU D00057]